VTWATHVPILVFLGLSAVDLGLMYATDSRLTDVRQTDVIRQTKASLNAPPIRGGCITSCRRAAATLYPAPLLPVGAEANGASLTSASAAEQRTTYAPVSHGQHVFTPTAAAA